MIVIFELEVSIDDVGVPTYFSKIISSQSVISEFPEDIDIHSMEGVGSTQLESIANLCLMIDDIIDSQL